MHGQRQTSVGKCTIYAEADYMEIKYYLIFALLGYLSGSVLYAYWLPKLICHVDVCTESVDGNPGAANAFQYGGITVGMAVLLMELLKGALPVYFSLKYVSTGQHLFALVMAAPVIGHAFPFSRHVRGGKSIAVSFGVLLGFYPDMRPVLLLALFYIIFSVILVIRPHFYRSIVTFAVFCASVFIMTGNNAFTIGCMVVSATVIYKHCSMAHPDRFSMRPFWKSLKRQA